MRKLKLTPADSRLIGVTKAGYRLDPNGRLTHRRLCREAWGWYPDAWVVHHIDEDKTNNAALNLIAMPKELHNQIHKIMRRDKITLDREYIKKAIRLHRPKL